MFIDNVKEEDKQDNLIVMQDETNSHITIDTTYFSTTTYSMLYRKVRINLLQVLFMLENLRRVVLQTKLTNMVDTCIQ